MSRIGVPCFLLVLVLPAAVAFGRPQDAHNEYLPAGPPPAGGYEPYATAVAARGQKVIPNVPCYAWRHGSGPTAAGMVLGYWDGHGFPWLIPGDASTQTAAVDQAIASGDGPGTHYGDYSLPLDAPPGSILPDLSEPPYGDEHASDSIADFMHTSWSVYGLFYSWSSFSAVRDAFLDYILHASGSSPSPYLISVRNDVWGAITWETFKAEIDAGRPLVLLVDSNGDGSTDHFVTAIGYRDASGYDEYACFDTWAPIGGVRWERFRPVSASYAWGIHGATHLDLQMVLYVFHGDSYSDRLGHSVSGAGDVNADGCPDLIAGAPLGHDSIGHALGMARVYSGLTGSVLYTFYGDWSLGYMGTSVSGGGDVNADGFADLIAGAPDDDSNGQSAGMARVYSGQTGGVLYSFYGSSAGDKVGYSVGGAGDVNADGFADVIAGAPSDMGGGTGSGSARVCSGQTGAVLYTFYGDSTNTGLGWSVSGAGDVNADGFADVIAGTPYGNNTGISSGSARVYSGKTGAMLFTFNGDSAGDLLGHSVSGAEDVNGDGFADLIAGAPADDNSAFHSGSARVYSGRTGAILYTFDGDSAYDSFGYSVSEAGDVNVDGFADLIAGAPYAYYGSGRGSARLFCGKTGAPLCTFGGDSGAYYLGNSVSGAGDVNGDWFPDLIVGSPFLHGSARVHSGLDAWCSKSIVGFGTGCGGSGGFTPELAVSGCATAGESINLTVGYALGGSNTLLFVGFAQASLPMGAGCTLNVSPPIPLFMLPLAGSGPGSGWVSLSLPVPAGIPLGSVATLQAFVVDPGAALGFSNTNGVQLTIQ